VFLADHLRERARPQALGQRHVQASGAGNAVVGKLGCWRNIGEKIVHNGWNKYTKIKHWRGVSAIFGLKGAPVLVFDKKRCALNK
jgi:hypothetical protein